MKNQIFILCRPSSHHGQPNELATSTRNTYNAAQQRFMAFCNTAKSHLIPVTKATLVLFATHLAVANISYAAIKGYPSGVRHLHVSAGLHDHFNLNSHLAFSRCYGISKNGKLWLTPKSTPFHHSCKIKGVLSSETYNTLMLWAACCIAFSGFMWVVEFTVLGPDDYDESFHLSLTDISVDSWRVF